MPIFPILRGPTERAKFWSSGDYLRGLPVEIPSDILRRLPIVGGSSASSNADVGFEYADTPRAFLLNPEVPSEYLPFQFNPQPLVWTKENTFGVRNYSGLAFDDTFFTTGGSRKVSFTLNFDYTPGALQLTKYHRLTMPSFNMSQEAFSVPTSLKQFINYIDSIDGLNGVGQPLNIIRSFETPKVQTGPKFSVNGHLLDPTRFAPYPRLIFSYGYYYLDCILTKATIRETHMSKSLRVLKAEAEIELTIKEAMFNPTV